MKRLLTILPLLSLLVTSCYQEPFADAIITPNPAWVGEDITFDNLSHNTDYVEWNMGDGSSSSAFNVVHYYTDPGTYDVTLSAYGKKGGVNVASFTVDVEGSELEIIVKEYWDEYLIEGASVVLFSSLDDWMEGDWENKGVAEQLTDMYGECHFSGLSYQRYYVDVVYRFGNDGYHNWFLGEEDVYFIETQLLEGGYDYTFVAYVDVVEFLEKKSTSQSGLRPALRPPLKDLGSQLKSATGKRPLKENKFSVKKERK